MWLCIFPSPLHSLSSNGVCLWLVIVYGIISEIAIRVTVEMMTAASLVAFEVASANTKRFQWRGKKKQQEKNINIMTNTMTKNKNERNAQALTENEITNPETAIIKVLCETKFSRFNLNRNTDPSVANGKNLFPLFY